MSRLYTTAEFIVHTLRSRRWDAFHSPFLFRLFTHCCDDTAISPGFQAIESQRAKWLNSLEKIQRLDLGAGSAYREKVTEKPISEIARHSLSKPFQCRFMSRLAGFTDSKHIVEFGTSLGISTAYLSVGAPGSCIQTVEADPEIAKRAMLSFDNIGLPNIQVCQSTFEEFASAYTPEKGKIDLFFLDGDHRMESTLHTYHALKHYFHKDTVIVVDDIYWSGDMNECWKKLTGLPEVTQSVDCFHFGLLFFNPGFLNKENHVIHLPWKMLLT